MIKPITVIAIILASACEYASADCHNVYGKIGAGYKFSEQKHFVDQFGTEYPFIYNSPYSARFELGVNCDRVDFGVSHHSQWTQGAPFNHIGEYYKTELFLDVKFDLWDL